MSDKGMFSAFVFVVLLMALVSIFWTMYNVFYGSKYQTLTLEESKIDILRNEIEKFKSFTREAIEYTTGKVMILFSQLGASKPDIGVWICNGDSSPDFQDVKRCMERDIKYYLDIYVENYSIKGLPLSELKIEKYQNLSMNITWEDVKSGKYDEGNIPIIVGGGSMFIRSRNVSISDKININNIIDKVRFWYLFRKFKEWSSHNSLSDIKCTCNETCRELDLVAKNALTQLQNKFDEYVNCSMEKLCCDSYTICCDNLNDCIQTATEDCNITCHSGCGERYLVKRKTTGYDESGFPCGSTDVTENWWAEVNYSTLLVGGFKYSCTDRKYYVHGEGKPNPLTFTVLAFIGYRVGPCGKINITCDETVEEICGVPCIGPIPVPTTLIPGPTTTLPGPGGPGGPTTIVTSIPTTSTTIVTSTSSTTTVSTTTTIETEY